MTDHFLLLEVPRRPWLEPEALKQKFLALSSAHHPDRAHNAPAAERAASQARYTGLNAAYSCLREPRTRLRHLLELERGGKPGEVQAIPADLMELFLELSKPMREADAFLREKAAVTSPLLKVRLFERGQEWSDKLAGFQRELRSRHDALLEQVKELDAAWPHHMAADEASRESALRRLEQVFRALSFIARWSEQLQERIVQLAL